MVLLKRRSYKKWDGDYKYKTKNCDDCEFRVRFHDKEICAWGVSFKYLVGRDSPRKCEYFGKEPPEGNSMDYVLEAIRWEFREKPKPAYVKQLELNFRC